jgi:tetratricopeptide (TPR) repeat protein
MVSNLLGTREVAKELEEFILERTEGVPFFIEELIKSLIDLKVIEKRGKKYAAAKELKGVGMPSTVQEVIMARVDSLAERVKKLLQVGSVMGREFSWELMRGVSGQGEQELLSQLSVLKDSELIFERGIYPQTVYIFKHALTQDAVYGSMLKSTREKYHKRVAEILERQFRRVVELQPELLGHHYTEAGLLEEAIPCWQRAGEIAIKRSAHTVAEVHITKGLKLLKSLPDKPERTQQEFDLQISLGYTLMVSKGFGAPEVKRALDREWELCQQVGETPKLFNVLHGLSAFYLAAAELKKSYEAAMQSYDLAKRFQDPASLIEGLHVLGSIFWWQGKYTSAQPHLEQAITLYDSLPQSSRILLPEREDPGVLCKGHAAQTLWLLGYPDQALLKMDTAFELAGKLSNHFDTAFIQTFSAMLHIFRREGQLSQKRAQEAIALSEKHGFVLLAAWARAFLGWALAEQGRVEEGIKQISMSIVDSLAIGYYLAQSHTRILLAEAYGRVGKIKQGLVELDEAQTIVDKNEGVFYDAELYRTRGELLLMQDPADEERAEKELRKGIDVARQQKSKSRWFTEGFDTADLKEAKILLDELS